MSPGVCWSGSATVSRTPVNVPAALTMLGEVDGAAGREGGGRCVQSGRAPLQIEAEWRWPPRSNSGAACLQLTDGELCRLGRGDTVAVDVAAFH